MEILQNLHFGEIQHMVFWNTIDTSADADSFNVIHCWPLPQSSKESGQAGH